MKTEAEIQEIKERCNYILDRMMDISEAAKLKGEKTLAAINLRLLPASEPLLQINRTLAWVLKEGRSQDPPEGRATIERYLEGMEEYISDVAAGLHSGEQSDITFDTVTLEYGGK